MSAATCAGGGLSLVHAFNRLQGFLDDKVLVVVAEKLTTAIPRSQHRIVEKVYGGLFADTAGACIVTSARRPGLVIEHAGQRRLPNSEDRYFVRLRQAGVRFASEGSRPAYRAI
ncbi:hypothetical protein [Streptomyces inhibens]|uniref:hypothetical protein n=1 Tax=Streptomyces inhibens TaxID=2293571 RepID=UPI0015F293EB|nr:hypothetical protein [Streptomyces inhibens]